MYFECKLVFSISTVEFLANSAEAALFLSGRGNAVTQLLRTGISPGIVWESEPENLYTLKSLRLPTGAY